MRYPKCFDVLMFCVAWDQSQRGGLQILFSSLTSHTGHVKAPQSVQMILSQSSAAQSFME